MSISAYLDAMAPKDPIFWQSFFWEQIQPMLPTTERIDFDSPPRDIRWCAVKQGWHSDDYRIEIESGWWIDQKTFQATLYHGNKRILTMAGDEELCRKVLQKVASSHLPV